MAIKRAKSARAVREAYALYLAGVADDGGMLPETHYGQVCDVLTMDAATAGDWFICDLCGMPWILGDGVTCEHCGQSSK